MNIRHNASCSLVWTVATEYNLVLLVEVFCEGVPICKLITIAVADVGAIDYDVVTEALCFTQSFFIVIAVLVIQVGLRVDQFSKIGTGLPILISILIPQGAVVSGCRHLGGFLH